MPRQVTNTMVQILAEKDIAVEQDITGKLRDYATDQLREAANALRTELSVPGADVKVAGDYASINCGAFSVGLQIRTHSSEGSEGKLKKHYIITAEGVTARGEPLPTVVETLQRLGYTPREAKAVPTDALSLL